MGFWTALALILAFALEAYNWATSYLKPAHSPVAFLVYAIAAIVIFADTTTVEKLLASALIVSHTVVLFDLHWRWRGRGMRDRERMVGEVASAVREQKVNSGSWPAKGTIRDFVAYELCGEPARHRALYIIRHLDSKRALRWWIDSSELSQRLP